MRALQIEADGKIPYGANSLRECGWLLSSSCCFPPSPYWLPVFAQREKEKATEIWSQSTSWPIFEIFSGLDFSNLFNSRADFEVPHINERLINKELHLRFCQKCVNEQRHRFGTSWWMRDLNLPLVAVCPLHQIPLFLIRRRDVVELPRSMPHNVLQSARPIIGKVDDASIEVVKVVIELCNNYQLINTCALRNFIEITRFKEERMLQLNRLGLSQCLVHPRLFCRSMTPHDGFMKDGLYDLSLVAFLSRYLESQGTISQLISESGHGESDNRDLRLSHSRAQARRK